jgi:hypothetical protein
VEMENSLTACSAEIEANVEAIRSMSRADKL